MKIYFAADHAGFELKQSLMNYARSTLGHEVEDCGAFEKDMTDDYPDFIGVAARKLDNDAAQGIDNRAIVIGASGQGEAMAANRFAHVRCALYYGAPGKDQTDAAGNTLSLLASSREHNNANALSLAARFLADGEAEKAVAAWLSTPFSGDERHKRRLQKLNLLGG